MGMRRIDVESHWACKNLRITATTALENMAQSFDKSLDN